MVDLTMLAPGPAGTTMIGESNIEAAARRGLAKRRRREKEMKFANEIPAKNTDADNPEATLPAHKSSIEDKSQEHPPSLSDRSKKNSKPHLNQRSRSYRMQIQVETQAKDRSSPKVSFGGNGGAFADDFMPKLVFKAIC
jgi:hypothetical protein